MLQQLANLGQHVTPTVRCASLEGKPFVQHQGFVPEQRVKARQSIDSQRMVGTDQCAQGVEAVKARPASARRPQETVSGL